jgi:hypothetical protein
VQNFALLRDDANLRLEPGRNTKIMRRLAAESKVEIERKGLRVSMRPRRYRTYGCKVRVSPTEVGWLLGSVLDYEAPAAIGGSAGRVQLQRRLSRSIPLRPDLGPIIWYVVGERRPAPPEVAFDGIRVFTWNLKKHRYETAIASKGAIGAYPLVVGKEGVNPMFQFAEMTDDGTLKPVRKFVHERRHREGSEEAK